MTESSAANEPVPQRSIPLSPQQVWKGRTDGQTLKRWFFGRLVALEPSR